MKTRHALLTAALGLFSIDASADIGPPPGLKGVKTTFAVESVDAFSAYVLLAYPCGDSSAPQHRGFVRIENGKTVTVGRRSGHCALYAMPKAEFDKWSAAHKPTAADDMDAIAKLFASPQVSKCKGAPTLTSIVPVEDPRSVVHEVLRATKIDGTGCEINVPAAATPSAPTAAPPPPASTPTPEPSRAPAQATEAPTAPSPKGGCGGCAIGSNAPAGTTGWLAAALAAWCVRRRRSRG